MHFSEDVEPTEISPAFNSPDTCMNLIRVLLSSVKKKDCQILFDRINDFLSSKHDAYPFFHFYNAALDIIKSKLGKPPVVSVSKKRPPSNCCHISFNNKSLDFINIHRILRDKAVINALPPNLRHDIPTVID